jgi:threonine synthase
VLSRLATLGATVTVCPRDEGARGDPCYRRFRAAVGAGAIPFGCQGPDNGLTIEGGSTLAWETAEALAEAGSAADRLVVQVGGGALASACIQGMEEAVALKVMAAMPVCDTVQTRGAYPLARAHATVADQLAAGVSRDHVLAEAAHHRSRYMWAWEATPASVAYGILDDETYDWLAVVRGMGGSGGSAIVADERTLLDANRLARELTGIDVDHTGSAGLAGLLAQSRAGRIEPDEDVVVIFSGARR